MSEEIQALIEALKSKLGDSIDSPVKFVIDGATTVIADSNGVRQEDAEADVTLLSDLETFKEIMSGDANPTSAFMTGKLKIEGDMGLAMKLSNMLS